MLSVPPTSHFSVLKLSALASDVRSELLSPGDCNLDVTSVSLSLDFIVCLACWIKRNRISVRSLSHILDSDWSYTVSYLDMWSQSPLDCWIDFVFCSRWSRVCFSIHTRSSTNLTNLLRNGGVGVPIELSRSLCSLAIHLVNYTLFLVTYHQLCLAESLHSVDEWDLDVGVISLRFENLVIYL